MRYARIIVVVAVAAIVASAAGAIAAAATFGGTSGPGAPGAADAPGAPGPADAPGAPGVTDGSTATVRPPPATSPRARANRRAARRDATSLVTKLNLPAGAASVSDEPGHDHGYLHPLPLLESEFASATAHAWWTAPGDPQSVIEAIEADPPWAATRDGTGSGGNVKTGTSELEVDYAWPPVTGVLGDRLLRVTVTRIGGGHTGVLAESQSVWIVPRPASERIPAATRIVQISSAVPGAADGGHLTITPAGQVDAIKALLDRLPIVQPGVTGCPGLMLPAKTITMTFRASASASVPSLAVLRFVDYRPWTTAYSSQCEPVQLSIGGRRRAALDGGGFIEGIERIIGLNLT